MHVEKHHAERYRDRDRRECGIIAVVVKAVNMATAVTDRREKDSTKTRLGKQHTAEGFTTKASMKNVTVSLAY